MSRARVCVVALIALSAAACRKKPPPPPPAPVAIVDAGPKEDTRPYAPQILARSIAPHAVHWLNDREMVLGLGMIFHRVDDKGEVTQIGKTPDYAKFLPDNDDDMGGYEVGEGGRTSQVSGSNARLFVKRIYPEDVMLWDGTSWSKTLDAPPEYEGRAHWMSEPRIEGADAGGSLLPEGPSWRVLVRLADGRALWLGESEHKTELLLVDKQHANARSIEPFTPQRDAKGVADYRCTSIPSRDGTAWLECGENDPDWGERFERKLHVLRLDGEAFVEVTLPKPGAFMRRQTFAVDDGGTLWYSQEAEESFPAEIIRVPRVGAWEKVTLPDPPAELERPFYSAEGIATRAKKTGDSPYRQWSIARVHVPRETKPMTRTVESIIPRPSGDVLVLARDSSHVNMVIRIARGATPLPNDKILLSGTIEDQRNEIRNTRPVRSWVGHCPQIFVTLGKDASKALAREAEIAAIVKKAHRPKKSAPQIVIVEGKLGGAPVSGIAILRTYPDVREEDVEATATRIIERFTTDPASPPDATCTLPVLEKVHKDYPSRAEDLDF